MDEDACPFECCTYQEWTAREAVEVLSSPEPDAATAFRVREVHDGVQQLDRSSTCAERWSRWARWTNAPTSVWWAKVRNAAGRTGWTTATRSFAGVDACG